ncbi:precorrin-6Y C5,15-methyltransferase (decarboxylating) subunit CbiT [Anaerosalibacter sp. Marseille-P3206]|uniref:precorrin-6Y C5,15-methyltransferase (decarboxylating) subunit CbiT n=1 Tax=Anaerosalibacter sp. Marseille-P3206 TaxID=1871005 RepID=UPI0009879F85|nr:precorrin-6Y C5,15-methyltransferase (decarboxylating) subunit CbiT [Anaerosalibacter sp. Marseille-P3206]
MKWVKDEEFIRGNIPMTKFEVRTLTIALLAIEKGDIFLDIGAGTGSISVEAALHEGEVHAIEMKREGVELIEKNASKFGVSIDIIEGCAPDCLPMMKFNKCFVGGSGGKLVDIFDYLEDNLEDNGIVCGNFVTLKNTNEFIKLLNHFNYKNIETRLIQTAVVDKLGLMKGNNPIFIVKGVK